MSVRRDDGRAAPVLLLAAALAACGAPRAAPSAPTPEPVPAAAQPRSPVRGTLPPIPAGVPEGDSITVRYPPRGATIATDSTFVFGSVGLVDATLSIDGTPVRVEPNGAFLAYLPVPENGLYRIEASARGADPISLEWPVNGALTSEERRPTRAGEAVDAPGPAAPESLVTQVTPDSGTLVLRGEPITYAARAPSGLDLTVALPGGRRVAMAEVSRPQGTAGFGRGAAGSRVTRYEATVAADLDLARTGAVLEAVVDGETASWALPALGVLEPGYSYPAEIRTERPDSTAIGRATAPPGTPYHWFLPNGTRVRATGVRDGQVRLRLTRDLSIWVAAADVDWVAAPSGFPHGETAAGEPLPGVDALADPAPGMAIGDAYSVRVAPDAGWVDVRVALSERLPFRVDARADGLDVVVYGARTRTNWVYQGPSDPTVRRAWWEQQDDERFVVHVETADTPWGWDARWEDGATLVVRVRRPPPVDPADPLRGLYVGVDAGHGDDSGAIGPTGLREGDANRRIAEALIGMLRDRGARVLETRPGAEDVGLGERPLAAADSGVHVLLSVHNNAFPDGVNPFENAGTSVLYNSWQSLDLARAVQRELVAALGLRDLGPIWGDLALARPTWMPSVLTETMFLMIPVQEAALRDPSVHERIAAAHVRGLEAFLRERLARAAVR